MRSGLQRCVHLAVFTALAAGIIPTPAAAEWVRIETPNFIVFGEASERRVREVAEQFERFREAIGRVIPAASAKAAVPTIVVVFETMRSFEPYRPRFNGKPIQVGGFFVSTENQNLVALAIEDRARALRIVLHEYAHLAVATEARNLPAWLSEGLAEHYSTFEVQEFGRIASVGRPIPEHLALLGQQRLIPHSELLAVDTNSPLYNEGERRSVFYAQSWALVHLMLMGRPDRSRELSQYIGLTESGVPADAAWTRVFGDLDVNEALRKYVAGSTMQYVRFRFDEDLSRVTGAVTRPTEAEVEATLGDLLYYINLGDEAAERLERAAAMQPASARARALLARIRFEQGHRAEAERLLMAASAAQADWLAQYYVAVGIDRLFDGLLYSDASTIARAGRDALAAVTAARPDLPHALALRARIGALTRADLDDALEDIRRARALAPGREDYAFVEAHVLLERREFAAARRVLGPLLTQRYHTDVRTRAKSLMADVVRLESVGLEAAERHASFSRPDAPAADEPLQASRDNLAPHPVFRKMRDGEQRTRGLLERIDCSARGVVLHLRDGNARSRFAAPRMEAIDFITYREDRLGEITCGGRSPADPVFLTWRQPGGAGSSRIAIAVEFLPHER